MNQYRCETCDYRSDRKDGIKCPYDREEVYYKLKEEMSFPRGAWLFTSTVGCASHSDFNPQAERDLPHLTSTELLLVAHDEWKCRQERKHYDDEVPWTSGWISGFLTSRKWANEKVAKLREGKDGE